MISVPLGRDLLFFDFTADKWLLNIGVGAWRAMASTPDRCILGVPCSFILQTHIFYHQAYLLDSMVTELVVGWTTSRTIAWVLRADVAPSSWPHPPEKRVVSNKIWGEGFWKISGSSHLDTHRDQGDRIELWTCCGFFCSLLRALWGAIANL